MSESSENSTGVENENENTEAEGNESTGLDGLGALLDAEAGDEQGGKPSGEGEGAETSGSESEKPTKFNDLAGRLDLDLDALYALTITLSDDGEPITIEELKDRHVASAELEMKEFEFEERRTEQEQALARAKTELHEILQALPAKAVKPEVLERIREKSEKQATLERARTLEVIPEWKDEKRRESDIEAMAKHLQGYGFPIDYLRNVVSHQQLKYIRDNWLREERVRAAMEKYRSGKPKPSGTQKPQGKPPRKDAETAPKTRGRDYSSKLEETLSQA